jgi:beta-glucosidase
VQLYLKHQVSEIPVPIHALQGFRKIHLDINEKKTVAFTLSPKQFSVINDNNERIVLPGNIQIFVGGQQPDEKLIGEGKILTANLQLTGKYNVVDKLDR